MEKAGVEGGSSTGLVTTKCFLIDDAQDIVVSTPEEVHQIGVHIGGDVVQDTVGSFVYILRLQGHVVSDIVLKAGGWAEIVYASPLLVV
jgi:hypothetical protein